MIKVKGLPRYDGGKSGNGTYQTLINHVPGGIRVIATACAGNCGLTRYIRPGEYNYINDLDKSVALKWSATLGADLRYSVTSFDCIAFLDILSATYKNKEDQVFVYIDLPYLFEARKSQKRLYKHEVDKEYHLRVLTKIATSRFKIMISHYPHPIYDEYLNDWEMVDYQSMTRKGLVTERIYMNYKLTGKLHDYTFLGSDYREREAWNRQRKNMIAKLGRMPMAVRNAMINDIASHFNAVMHRNKRLQYRKKLRYLSIYQGELLAEKSN